MPGAYDSASAQADADRIAAAARVDEPGVFATALVDALTGTALIDDVESLGQWLGTKRVGAEKLLLPDLLLAWRAAHGDQAAVAEVHDRARHAAGRIHRSLLSESDAEDVVQKVTLRLLDDQRVLLGYGGRGSLVGWLRVILTREALALKKKARRASPLDDDDLLDIPGFTASPELKAAKQEHRDLVQRSIQGAVRALSPEDAEALRSFYLAGATLDALAEKDGVHRATISKRLRKIRERLLRDATGRLKEEQSKLSQSAIAFVMSQVEVSIDRALTEAADEE